MGTKLSIRILRVKCVDETNGKWVEKFGNDEIYLGGFSVMPNGDTSEILPSSIYPHFDDGDVKVFSPPKIFHTFSPVGEMNNEFAIGLILIEKDEGGATQAVQQITEKAQELIKAGLATVGGLLGTAINFVIGPLLSHISKKIVVGVRDDLFLTQIVNVSIPHPGFTWSGSNHSAEKTLRIAGHGGIYELTYDWEFV
ncbi:hypothetical protein [Dyadobacter sp. CY312]|uniref:hypothetical protein n=1 Tax=Dyadobacter sp. CY312 TaxID=2907303 RepID=UPI001F252628|nr:hypothetical protein [Dyadobacter sp. CY312]MCE7042047.1 hypothetical protein [Dyadobacter sp. CY312]